VKRAGAYYGLDKVGLYGMCVAGHYYGIFYEYLKN
jgi:hypothetical protein